MGKLLTLMTSSHFRTRIGMYVGATNFREIEFWLRGYDLACGEFGENDLDGFYEWLMMNVPDSPANVGWTGIIAERFGNVEGAAKLFELFDRFVEQRAEVGLPEIVRQHAEYEQKRWGRLNVSRLLEHERR